MNLNAQFEKRCLQKREETKIVFKMFNMDGVLLVSRLGLERKLDLEQELRGTKENKGF